MVLLNDFIKAISFDTKTVGCMEVSFYVEGSRKFCNCFMGKMPDSETKKDIYWFGLTPDGTNVYDYDNADDFIDAKVFDGKSL